MTTTANKAGLKAAATRRTAKHAQTTPLPPKAGDIDLALEAVMEAAAAKAAPRKRAAKKVAPAEGPAAVQEKEASAPKPARKRATKKAAALAAEDTYVQETVVAAEAAALARSVGGDEPIVVEPAKKGPGYTIPPQEEEPETETAAKPEASPEGDTKAHRNVQTFSSNGWTVTVQVDGTYAELIALRGTEAIHQAWEAGVYHNDSATYTIADRTVRTRNVAEAKRWAARSPEAAQAELAKVGSNKAFVKKAPEALVRYELPFDAKTVTEMDLWNHLTGKGVRWHNRLSNSEETAIVGGSPRWFSIQEYAGTRIVQFVCQAQGFRAFKLDNLLAVGRGVRRVKAGQADISEVDLVDESEVSLSVDVE